jgi:hypothetical protein
MGWVRLGWDEGVCIAGVGFENLRARNEKMRSAPAFLRFLMQLYCFMVFFLLYGRFEPCWTSTRGSYIDRLTTTPHPPYNSGAITFIRYCSWQKVKSLPYGLHITIKRST